MWGKNAELKKQQTIQRLRNSERALNESKSEIDLFNELEWFMDVEHDLQRWGCLRGWGVKVSNEIVVLVFINKFRYSLEMEIGTKDTPSGIVVGLLPMITHRGRGDDMV